MRWSPRSPTVAPSTRRSTAPSSKLALGARVTARVVPSRSVSTKVSPDRPLTVPVYSTVLPVGTERDTSTTSASTLFGFDPAAYDHIGAIRVAGRIGPLGKLAFEVSTATPRSRKLAVLTKAPIVPRSSTISGLRRALTSCSAISPSPLIVPVAIHIVAIDQPRHGFRQRGEAGIHRNPDNSKRLAERAETRPAIRPCLTDPARSAP